MGIYVRYYVKIIEYNGTPDYNPIWGDYDLSNTASYRYRYKDIAVFSDTTQIREALIYSGTRSIVSTNILYLQQVRDFIYVRYRLKLNIIFKDLYIDQMKDVEHQTKLFDFILDKEIGLEQQGNTVK